MNNQALDPVERTAQRHYLPGPGRQLDQPVEGGSNESTRQPGGWWVEAGGRVGWTTSSTPSTAGLRRRRSKQEGEVNHLGGKREGGGAEDRDERGIEGAAGFYTRAKRREARDARSGGAKPEGAAHRQRQEG